MKKALTMALAVALAGVSVMAQSYEAGDWIVRAGATTVDPDTDSDVIDPTIPFKVDVDDDTQLGIIPAYMVTEKWAVEVLTSTPFEHDINVENTSLQAGSTKHLPPTVSVQWYPRGGKDGWQPYIGAGVNYTLFWDEEADNQLIDFLGVDDADLSLDNSFGLAAQAGVDIPFGEHWAVNLGVWYIDIDTKAEIKAKVAGQTVAKVKFDVELDPWVYNVGIAYKF
jgi:outer membrane protein